MAQTRTVPKHMSAGVILVDRQGLYPDARDRLPDLFALPAALGLTTGTDPSSGTS
mgnify:CR=1 FL=1